MTDRKFSITGDTFSSDKAVKGEDLENNNNNNKDEDNKEENSSKKDKNDDKDDKSKTNILNISGIDSR